MVYCVYHGILSHNFEPMYDKISYHGLRDVGDLGHKAVAWTSQTYRLEPFYESS